MTIKEFIESQNRIHDRLNATFRPAAAIQKQLSPSIPIFKLQERMRQTYEPIQSLLKQYKNIQHVFNPNTLNIIQAQQKIIRTLPNFDFDISTTPISTESSIKFTEIALDAVNEIESNDLPEELKPSKEFVPELTNQKKALTWEQVILIITFIFGVITFIQSQLPDQQQIECNNYLEQLIELQTKELELIDPSNNSLMDEGE